MASVPTRTSAILMILNSVLSSNLFGFVARSTTPWPDENDPPTEVDPSDFDQEVDFTKRLDSTNVRFMIPRVDWTARTYSLNEFVITDSNDIYRCSTPGTSSSKPVHLAGIGSDIGGTSSWEYIDSLTSPEATRFLTESWMPLSIKEEKYFLTTDLIKRVRIAFDISGAEGGTFPVSKKYRVAGVWSNPFLRADRNNTTGTPVSDYGTPLVWVTLEAETRVQEQVDIHVFDISIPDSE